METVAIVGVGLIGGSFGLALKKAGFHGRVLGVSSPPALADALERGAIDIGTTLERAAAEADLVYLAQPITRILETLPRLGPAIRPGTLVTDAGSTKAQIVRTGRGAVRSGQFLGGHPMAGKEKRGAAEADADLFAGRTYVLTPSSRAELETPAARDFLGWIEKIGAVPVVLDAAEHDRIVAFTSHLPQLLSTALAVTIAGHLGSERDLQVAGPGLSDTTRLAASSYDIWGDILKTNTGPIGAALDACIAKLQHLRAVLCTEGMRKQFRIANDCAERIRKQAADR